LSVRWTGLCGRNSHAYKGLIPTLVDKTKTPKKLEKNWKRRKPLKKIYLPFIVFIVAVSPLLLLAVSLFAPFIVFIVAVSPLLLLAVLLFGPTVHRFYFGCLAITSTGRLVIWTYRSSFFYCGCLAITSTGRLVIWTYRSSFLFWLSRHYFYRLCALL
jgi:hypothetical protein